jgi:hypothetical protein
MRAFRSTVRRSALLALAALAMLAAPRAEAVERAGLEAAIVYNLLQFVEWPGEAALPAGTPLAVCLDAASPLLPELQSLEGRPVRRMRLAVRELAPAEAAQGCGVIYVDAAGRHRGLAARRPASPEAPALVIGGSDLARGEGLMVRLDEAGGRLVFDIDMKAAREAGLVVSSRLLRLARKVTE